jgi:hypothetical protein
VKDAAEFRKRAEECRQMAGASRTPEDQALWVRLAEDWLSLAKVADEHDKKAARPDTKNSK